jgi:hypothetical protein
MKIKCVFCDTLYGVSQTWEIVESNNQFLIGRRFYSQNYKRKLAVGFEDKMKEQTLENFSISLGEGNVEILN